MSFEYQSALSVPHEAYRAEASVEQHELGRRQVEVCCLLALDPAHDAGANTAQHPNLFKCSFELGPLGRLEPVDVDHDCVLTGSGSQPVAREELDYPPRHRPDGLDNHGA